MNNDEMTRALMDIECPQSREEISKIMMLAQTSPNAVRNMLSDSAIRYENKKVASALKKPDPEIADRV